MCLDIENIDRMDADALSELAFHFENRKEYDKAALCLTKAAELGDKLATFYIAQYYEKGQGVAQDYEKAAVLYMEVSACNEPLVFADPTEPLTPQCDAEYALGSFYEKGLLPDSTIEKAAQWYARAAADGHADAYFKMAELHFLGHGVAQSVHEAARYLCDGYYWSRGGDERYFTLAQALVGKVSGYDQISILKMLGDFYTKGLGVEKDADKASDYYAEANRLTAEENAKIQSYIGNLL